MNQSTKSILWIALAWILIALYSVFQVSAAESFIDRSGLQIFEDTDVKQMAIFLYGLAVVSFLGGSQVPAVFLKKKMFTVQFVFSAIFGFILLLITVWNENILGVLSEPALNSFFVDHPLVALEYLVIPYAVMFFLDAYANDRLTEFSWSAFGESSRGIFLRPRKTFDEVVIQQSKLFSLAAILIIAVGWIMWDTVFYVLDFLPTRTSLVPSLSTILSPTQKMMLTIPSLLLVWLITSALVSLVANRLGGRGGFSETTSVAGFAFYPILIAGFVDLIEYALFEATIQTSQSLFLAAGFLIPFILWPLALLVLAIKTAESISTPQAILTSLILVPIILPLVFIIL
ncbi:MAG: YIP1 family protein [Candidatus Bathyarchaeota archaeon]|nr:MAG: YIP1 family protein [Candidatus Bathyarchaeota archaeon]